MAQDIRAGGIPLELQTEQASSVNMRYIIGGLLLLVFVGFLGYQIVRATTTTGAYFMTVSELLAESDIQGQRIRVNGNVVAGSEDRNAQEILLKFSIVDEGGTQNLPIVFKGPRPDNFQRGASAIIEGELLADGTFQADTLLLKCPSRYEEEPESGEILVKATR